MEIKAKLKETQYSHKRRGARSHLGSKEEEICKKRLMFKDSNVLWNVQVFTQFQKKHIENLSPNQLIITSRLSVTANLTPLIYKLITPCILTASYQKQH